MTLSFPVCLLEKLGVVWGLTAFPSLSGYRNLVQKNVLTLVFSGTPFENQCTNFSVLSCRRSRSVGEVLDFVNSSSSVLWRRRLLCLCDSVDVTALHILLILCPCLLNYYIKTTEILTTYGWVWFFFLFYFFCCSDFSDQ